ncbi:MAG: Hpt domain-containing protein [Marinilabiliaceae bacterium]
MPVVDYAYIDKACGGDEQLRSELISLFAEQLRSLSPDLKALLASGDWQSLAREAHSVKSTALSFGMKDLAVALKKVEIVCKRILLSSPDSGLADSVRKLYADQIEAQPAAIREWTAANQSEKSISILVDFCKLQADLALSELRQGGFVG